MALAPMLAELALGEVEQRAAGERHDRARLSRALGHDGVETIAE